MTRLFRTLAVLATTAALVSPVRASDDALSLIPANAVTVGVLHLAEMRTSPLSSFLFQHIDEMITGGEADTILLGAGLQPLKDVDRLVVATSPRSNLGSEADVLVVVEGRFQPERLAATLLARGAVRKGAYILLDQPSGRDGDESGAVAFVSSSLVIAGNERSVVNALAARASGGTGFLSRGTLAMDLGRIEPAATAWAIVDVPRAARLAKGSTTGVGNGQSGAALQAALKSVATVAMWVRDTGDALQLGAIGLSNDRETLQLLEDTLRGALAALRIVAQDKVPAMVSVLRRFDVDRSSESITVKGVIPAATLRELMTKKVAVAVQ